MEAFRLLEDLADFALETTDKLPESDLRIQCGERLLESLEFGVDQLGEFNR